MTNNLQLDAGCRLTFVGIGLMLAAGRRERMLGYLATIIKTGVLVGMLELSGAIGLVSWSSMLAPTGNRLADIGPIRFPHLDARGTTFQDTATAWGFPSEPVAFHYKSDASLVAPPEALGQTLTAEEPP